ncbi:MAG: hypothetical protein MHM6MM_001971 [Cercozoa sp. M6MM]
MVEALRKNAAQKDYLPVRGLPQLRESIVQHLSRHHGVSGRSWEHTITGPGSKELLFMLQLVLDAELLLPMPSWVSYSPQAALCGNPVTPLPVELTPETLDEVLQQPSNRSVRVLLLNSPNNPSGTTLCTGEDEEQVLRRFAEVIEKYPDVIVVSDEIYAHTRFDGRPHQSLAHFCPEQVVVLTGVAKWAGAGGWRLGSLSFPAAMSDVVDAMAIAASESFTSVSAPIQNACIPGYDMGPEMQEYIERSKKVLAVVASGTCRYLAEHAPVQVDAPNGGFYCMPRIGDTPWAQGATEYFASKQGNDMTTFRSTALVGDAFAQHAIEKGHVAFLPASCFISILEDVARPTGVEKDSTRMGMGMRLSYVDFDGTKALEVADQLPALGAPLSDDLVDSWLDQHAPKIRKGATTISRLLASDFTQ